MSEHERDLAAAGALGGLGADEAARLEAEAATSPALAAELAEYRATVSALQTAVVREAPPPDLFAGVLARIEAESQAPVQEAAPVPDRGRRREWSWQRLLPSFAAGAVAAAAVFALAFVLFGGDDLGSPDARAEVRGTEEFATVAGQARLYGVGGSDGTLVLDLDEVPAPAPGEHYEVWVLRGAGDGEMEAVGVFSPETESVELEFRLPGPGDYEAVDVSVEPDGGPAEHSGQSLAGGRFEPVTA